MLSEQAVCRRTTVNRPFQPRFAFSVFAVFSVSGLAAPLASANPIPDQMIRSTGSVIYVNPAIGSDSALGQANSPLKTITVALDRAAPNSTIVLLPGVYSVETGEVFPIQLKPSVTVQGDPRDRGQNVVIRGGDMFLSRSFARQNVTILGANGATLTGVTVTNPNPQGYGLWTESSSPVVVANTFAGSSHDGASIVGNSAPILKNNYFHQNGANGITIYGTSRPELQENIFERTGFGVNISQNAAPRLIGNRITLNKDGIVIQGNAQPILRNNVIDSNDRDGIVSIAQSRPDLGTSADPGNNTFVSNRQFDVNAQRTTQTVPAFGNQLSARTIGRLDLSGIDNTPPITTNIASSTGFGQARPLTSLTPITINARSPVGRSRSASASGAIEIPVPAPMSNPTPVVQRRIARSAFPRPMNSGQFAPLPIARSTFARPMDSGQSASLPIARSAFPRPTEPRQSASLPVGQSILLPASAFPRSATPIQINSISRAPVSQPSAFQARRAVPAGLLPVPRAVPPIGNTRGTTVRVWRGGGARSAAVVSQAASLGFRFRVIVRANTDIEQSQLRSVVPGAFSLRGRNVMQAGAFRDRTEADELLQVLMSQGLQAAIEGI
ncbi:DUF1565 domain-containing protein [Cyanobacteria bacterium FACHB-DQ100]|nr:DUF1565 domain-containing protein [Cyanobacteria bacterium FACHB-DQ100]